MIKQMTKKNLLLTRISLVGDAPQRMYKVHDVCISVVKYTNKKNAKNKTGSLLPYHYMMKNRTVYEVLPLYNGICFNEDRLTLCQVNSILKKFNKTKSTEEALKFVKTVFKFIVIGECK